MCRIVVLSLLFVFVLPFSVSAMILPDIVFVRKPIDAPVGDSYYDIYSIDINGDNLTRLTDNYTAELDPLFSPIDNYLSFYGNPQGDSRGGVFRMDFDGGGILALSGTGGGSEQSWSPDGTQIVFKKYTADASDLYIVNRDGTNLHKINQDGGVHIDPKWSPRGDRIAYVTYDGTYIIDTDGQNKVGVATVSDYAAIWSPDGNKLYFDDPDGLWSINADGTGKTKLWPASGSDPNYSFRDKVISGDGKTIAFIAFDPGADPTGPVKWDRIAFLNLETLEVNTVVFDELDLFVSNLNWSGDKKYLIFTAYGYEFRSPKHIYRYDYETGELLLLTEGNFIDNKVHLRPTYAFYNEGNPEGNSIPEPTTIFLFSAGVLGLLMKKRQQ